MKIVLSPTHESFGEGDDGSVCAAEAALVGDPLQFSAVGRGGMFGLLVDTFGAIELERSHRFDNEWERDANLRLRRGDVTVADLYEQHGRLNGGTVTQRERQAVARWWELLAGNQCC